MRSTLLFVAVLFACTPVHAHATAPSAAQIIRGDLASFLLAQATPAGHTLRINHQTPQAIVVLHRPAATVIAAAQAPRNPTVISPQSAAPRLHDPNAP